MPSPSLWILTLTLLVMVLYMMLVLHTSSMATTTTMMNSAGGDLLSPATISFHDDHNAGMMMLRRGAVQQQQQPPQRLIPELRSRLSPSFWATAGADGDAAVQEQVAQNLTVDERERALQLCGKFLYSTLRRAVQVHDMGEHSFVVTGDIDYMWTRDSAVQIGLYMGRLQGQPWLRLIVEGAIRRQAFHMIQDPYANAYYRQWVDPTTLPLKDRVIGRGGWVATRNYELDSGAYFLTQLYDYYVASDDLYRPEALLSEPIIFDAVLLLVETWITEQRHDEQSPYRYFELSNNGSGAPSSYTGMTWTAFRPSDDPCQYGYLIPANIHAAAGLQRALALNERIWKSQTLHTKATKLLQDIQQGINEHGIVTLEDGTRVYAYEVDGNGNALTDFDDANVPSLLSIPLLGWSGYDRSVYKTTRDRLLSSQTNPYYFQGAALRGIGSPHTGGGLVWPMTFTVQALSEPVETVQEKAQARVFQLRQSMTSACNDAMHEGVSSEHGCNGMVTRQWFEWPQALFVVLVEEALGERCEAAGQEATMKEWIHLKETTTNNSNNAGRGRTVVGQSFYQNKYKNDHMIASFYQGVQAATPYVN